MFICSKFAKYTSREKKVTEDFLKNILYHVYKDNKQTNGKSSDYNFGVGHR
jgi:hypothetical protein